MRTITTHPVASCGCQATSWYAWSDDGLHDDGDTVVDECAWHWLLQAAFNTWLERRIDLSDQSFDAAYWAQVVEREDEWSTWEHDYAWERAAKEAAWYTPLGVEPPF